MPAKTTSIPTTLDQHLSANSRDDVSGIAAYVDRGAALVTPEAIAGLQRLRTPLRKKIAALPESGHLRQRLELLAAFFDATSGGGQKSTPALSDATFALLYFLKGFDRIPDTVPEVGLLDDAMVVQYVLHRNATALQAFCQRRHHAWPAELCA